MNCSHRHNWVWVFLLATLVRLLGSERSRRKAVNLGGPTIFVRSNYALYTHIYIYIYMYLHIIYIYGTLPKKKNKYWKTTTSLQVLAALSPLSSSFTAKIAHKKRLHCYTPQLLGESGIVGERIGFSFTDPLAPWSLFPIHCVGVPWGDGRLGSIASWQVRALASGDRTRNSARRGVGKEGSDCLFSWFVYFFLLRGGG